MEANYHRLPFLLCTDIEADSKNPQKNHLLEICAILHDRFFNEYNRLKQVVHVDKKTLEESLDDWSRKIHTKNGLLEEVKQSKVTVAEVENQLIANLVNAFQSLNIPDIYVQAKDGKAMVLNFELFQNNVYIFGSSVSFDKQILDRLMPTLANMITFRCLDVSCFWVASLLYGNKWLRENKPKKKPNNHRAEGDIENSINLMKFYCHVLFGQRHIQYSP